MRYFSDLAKKYNAEVFIAMRLLVVTIPVRSNIKYDIGFGRSDQRRSVVFHHYDLGCGVYVYGYGAKEIAVHLRDTDRFPNIIRHLFSEYAFSIEWNGENLVAQVNMWYCVPSEDGTNGERFLIELRDVASSIQSAASLSGVEPQKRRFKIGPSWLRKASNVSGFFAPIVGLIIFLTIAIHRIWPMMDK
ncbi:hypothetical protein [Burkholderia pyrrocinia]|uniref:hypothetical protein n=1 Tax=Burkholderia pyrrocinia TaxID=60550 RepID=UPI00126039DC|nr:hypothetical protein [Burkholderia pyrrocinia]